MKERCAVIFGGVGTPLGVRPYWPSHHNPGRARIQNEYRDIHSKTRRTPP